MRAVTKADILIEDKIEHLLIILDDSERLLVFELIISIIVPNSLSLDCQVDGCWVYQISLRKVISSFCKDCISHACQSEIFSRYTLKRCIFVRYHVTMDEEWSHDKQNHWNFYIVNLVKRNQFKRLFLCKRRWTFFNFMLLLNQFWRILWMQTN